LLAALSACHMFWYLHLCADAGIAVRSYDDAADCDLQLDADGSGQFKSATLRPIVRLEDLARSEEALLVHEKAHAMCFIARSMNFPVHCEPRMLA